jgi:hypothetical protein
VANFGVIGPHFVEDEHGRAVTVTSAHYVEMLRNFHAPELSCRGIELSTIRFQQDGATTHTARASLKVVLKLFPEHVISLCGELPWPARSPDLSACDHFLWEYIKAKVYTTRPRTVGDFKKISMIPENMAR